MLVNAAVDLRRAEAVGGGRLLLEDNGSTLKTTVRSRTLNPKWTGEEVRVALGLIVLAVCARVAWTLVSTPDDIFSLGQVGGHQ